jgi:hypothetical protein
LQSETFYPEAGFPRSPLSWAAEDAITAVNDLVLVNNWQSGLTQLAFTGEQTALGPIGQPAYDWTEAIYRVGNQTVAVSRQDPDEKGRDLVFHATSTGTSWQRIGAAVFEGDHLVGLASHSIEGPAVLIFRASPPNDTAPGELKIFRSANWEDWISVGNPALPGNDASAARFTDQRDLLQCAWDGRRFILRNAVGELWISSDGLSWTQLPPLPDDSVNYLRAVNFLSEDIEYHPDTLVKNYAYRFASNGDVLVLRPAKFSERFDFLDTFGPDVFFVFSFNEGKWRKVTLPRPNGWHIGYGDLEWTGRHFIATSQWSGLVATSEDGINWVQREALVNLEHIRWTGSRLLGITDQGGILSHPDGLSPRVDIVAGGFLVPVGLGTFYDGEEDRWYIYEANYSPDSALGDDAVQLVDSAGTPHTMESLRDLVGIDPWEVPSPTADEVSLSREANIVTMVVPAPAGAHTLELDTITGIVRRIGADSPPAVTGTKKQKIRFKMPARLRVGRTYRLNARATSKLPVTYSVSDPAIAEIIPRAGKEGQQLWSLKVLAEGTTTITATQAGDSKWKPAAPRTRAFTARPPKNPLPQ